MTLLQDLNKLHDKWDANGGQSGSDRYDDALYDCINDLADLILKHTKQTNCTCNGDTVNYGKFDQCLDCGLPK